MKGNLSALMSLLKVLMFGALNIHIVRHMVKKVWPLVKVCQGAVQGVKWS